MIEFINKSNSSPFKKLYDHYLRAIKANQEIPQATVISSLNHETNEVNSRYVNLKIIDDEDFVFFSNYKSPKAKEFKSHDQIAAAIYWSSINVQIRIKARISKTTVDYNKIYFKSRSIDKNALAISSRQSSVIKSYDLVVERYKKTKKEAKLDDCPDYWGGYVFRPYIIEFWQGHDYRLNKRELFTKENNEWDLDILEP